MRNTPQFIAQVFFREWYSYFLNQKFSHHIFAAEGYTPRDHKRQPMRLLRLQSYIVLIYSENIYIRTIRSEYEPGVARRRLTDLQLATDTQFEIMER